MKIGSGQFIYGSYNNIYLQKLCTDTGWSMEDQLRAMTIGTSGGRGSGKSMLAAYHDDDDDDTINNTGT